MAASDEVDTQREAFRGYLREERFRGVETVKRYDETLREFSGFLRRVHTDVALSAISYREIAAFLRQRATRQEEPSPSAWNMALAALRSFYAYLNRKEILLMNPTLSTERQTVDSPERVPLSLGELVALIRAAEKSKERYRRRNIAIVHVLFCTALRVRELVSIDIEQIDWQAHVFLNVRTKGAGWLSPEFTDMTSEVLESYVWERTAQQGAPKGALFVSNRRTRLSVRSVQEIIRTLAKAAGVSRTVTPHLFRHTTATELHKLGTPMRVIQDVCGHASVETTEGYVHVNANERRLAISALGNKLAQRLKTRRAA